MQVGLRRSIGLAVFLIALVFAWRFEYLPKWFLSEGRPCDPYNSFGYLNIDIDSPHANRWTSFDPTCRTPPLVASLARHLWADRPDQDVPKTPLTGNMSTLRADMAPDGQEWEDVAWAKSRTIVVIGDSVSRQQLKHFCEVRQRMEPSLICRCSPAMSL
jgi:hypothetical protein